MWRVSALVLLPSLAGTMLAHQPTLHITSADAPPSSRSAVAKFPCYVHKACDACGADPACGWCAGNLTSAAGTCLPASPNGLQLIPPAGGRTCPLPQWKYKQCDSMDDSCSSATNCLACSKNLRCGWCAGGGLDELRRSCRRSWCCLGCWLRPFLLLGELSCRGQHSQRRGHGQLSRCRSRWHGCCCSLALRARLALAPATLTVLELGLAPLGARGHSRVLCAQASRCLRDARAAVRRRDRQ